MQDPNCIFCKIAQKEIPTEFSYEDGDFVAFLDIHPVSEGHTLLIPKAHYPWFYEVPTDIAQKWFTAAQTLAKKLKDQYSSHHIEMKIIGVDIPHAHIHLIPKKLT
jgi:histidine triad (HIT) family protein